MKGATHIIKFVLIITALLLCPAFAVAQEQPPEPTPPPEVSKELLTKVEQMEKDWLEAVKKQPKIVVFEGMTKQQSPTREEFWRSHLIELRDKAQSNRAWYEYWKHQGELTKALSDAYREVLTQAAEHENLKKIKETYSNRLEGIAAWSKLAGEKVENQDRYLNAMETETEAYEDRLDAAVYEKAAVDENGGKDDDKDEETVFLKSEADQNTPYRAHKEKLAVLESRRKHHLEKKEEAENDAKFATKLIEAAEQMLTAADADLKLAEREHEIAKQQITSALYDKQWRNAWKTIEDGVETKLETLRKVLTNQEQSVTTLKQDRAYYEAVGTIKSERAEDVAKQIELLKKDTIRVVLVTIKEIALRKGLIIIAYLLVAFVAVKLIRIAGKVAIEKASDNDADTQTDIEQRVGTLVSVFSSVGKTAVYIIVPLLMLDALGVNVGPLMGAFAIFGLAISFGSQSLVKDVVNGFFMLLEHQFSQGDVVEVAGISGVVEKISLRRVVLRDVKGTLHSIPNNQIAQVSNMTHGWARAIVHVGVGYGTDLVHTQTVFNEVGRKMYEDPEWQEKLMEAPSVVGITELGDSAVVFRVWCKTNPFDQWAIERELNWRLKAACDEAGIEIPFPQRVVEIKK